MKEKHILTINKVFDAQVCSAGSYDEALDFIRAEHPAGTKSNWQKNEQGSFAPLKCADDPSRTHYMFQC